MARRPLQEVTADIERSEGVTVTRERVEPAPVPETPPQRAYEQKKTIFRSYQVIWYIVTIVEFLLVTRLFLKFLGANPASGFASAIYALSFPFAAPFTTLFRPAVEGSTIVEWGTLIAIIIYPILASFVTRLFQFVKPTTPEEVEEEVDTP